MVKKVVTATTEPKPYVEFDLGKVRVKREYIPLLAEAYGLTVVPDEVPDDVSEENLFLMQAQHLATVWREKIAELGSKPLSEKLTASMDKQVADLFTAKEEASQQIFEASKKQVDVKFKI